MRALKVAFKYIRRSPYQAIAAVLVTTLTFFVAALVFLLGVGSTVILSHFESRPQITAFLKDEVTESEINSLKDKLNSTGKIASTKFISKDEALNIYKEQNKNDPILLEMVTADILPASLEVSANDVKELSSLAEIIKGEEIVDEVGFQKDVVESLISWINAIKTIGAFLFLFLSVVSLFIILTVTGIRIALRKEEIEILRLVGASSWYIRAPFILEGVIYGVFGSFVAWLVSYILILYSSPFLTSLLVGLPLTFPPGLLFNLAYLSGLLLLGGLLGVIGSFFAVKRYL